MKKILFTLLVFSFAFAKAQTTRLNQRTLLDDPNTPAEPAAKIVSRNADGQLVVTDKTVTQLDKENLSEFTDDIGATDPIAPNSAFYNADATLPGKIGNAKRPFATDAAMYQAMLEDGERYYTVYFTREVDRTLTEAIPDDLKVTFVDLTAQTTNFSYSGNLARYFRYFSERGKLALTGPRVTIKGDVLSINTDRIDALNPANEVATFYPGKKNSYIIANHIRVENTVQFYNSYFSTDSKLEVKKLEVRGTANLRLTEAENVIIDNLFINGYTGTLLLQGNGSPYKKCTLKRVTGTAYTGLQAIDTILDIDGLVSDNTLNIRVGHSNNTYVTGRVRSDNVILIDRGPTTSVTLYNYHGRINKLSQWNRIEKLIAINSTIKTPGPLVKYENVFPTNSPGSRSVLFENTTVIQDTPTKLFEFVNDGATEPVEVKIVGKLRGNFEVETRANVTVTDLTPNSIN